MPELVLSGHDLHPYAKTRKTQRAQSSKILSITPRGTRLASRSTSVAICTKPKTRKVSATNALAKPVVRSTRSTAPLARIPLNGSRRWQSPFRIRPTELVLSLYPSAFLSKLPLPRSVFIDSFSSSSHFSHGDPSSRPN